MLTSLMPSLLQRRQSPGVARAGLHIGPHLHLRKILIRRRRAWTGSRTPSPASTPRPCVSILSLGARGESPVCCRAAVVGPLGFDEAPLYRTVPKVFCGAEGPGGSSVVKAESRALPRSDGWPLLELTRRRSTWSYRRLQAACRYDGRRWQRADSCDGLRGLCLSLCGAVSMRHTWSSIAQLSARWPGKTLMVCRSSRSTLPFYGENCDKDSGACGRRVGARVGGMQR